MSGLPTHRFVLSTLAFTLSILGTGCAESHVVFSDGSVGSDGSMLSDGGMMRDAEGIDIGFTIDGGRSCESDSPSGRPGAPAEPPAPPLNVCRTSSDCSGGTGKQ